MKGLPKVLGRRNSGKTLKYGKKFEKYELALLKIKIYTESFKENALFKENFIVFEEIRENNVYTGAIFYFYPNFVLNET